MEVFICGWNDTLSLYQHKTRYCLCSQPSSLVHFQSQAVPCFSCQDDHQIPLCNLRSRHHLCSYHCHQGSLFCGCWLHWFAWLTTSGPICKCLLSYRIHNVHLLLPSHLEKSTSNRDCPQHLPCRICCPLLRHQKTHHHPMSSPGTCPLLTPFLHNACHPC